MMGIKTLRIIADENIPDAHAALSPLGELTLLPGRGISNADVRNCDALVLRSVTKVNAELLSGAPVRFVGSCTIGADHLDASYLDAQNIDWCTAPGCNANSVADYVLSALCTMPDGLSLAQTGVGLVGYGGVGQRVAARLRALEFQVAAYDPFIEGLQSLAEVFASPVVCLHAPLTNSGSHPTLNMIGLELLNKLPKNAILLSAGRGGVVADAVLKQFKRQRPDVRLVLDVWENEPNIDVELLAMATIATPHIAGYSLDGKRNGLSHVRDKLIESFGLQGVAPIKWSENDVSINTLYQFEAGDEVAKEPSMAAVRQAMLACYDVRRDDAALREKIAKADNELVGEQFDRLRKFYPERREIKCFELQGLEALSLSQQKLLLGLQLF